MLGSGGFGITYLAKDQNLRKPVAIKKYFPMQFAVRKADASVQLLANSHSEDFNRWLERFMEETQTLTLFAHPHIVRVLTCFEANGTGYMIMDHKRGENLKEILDRLDSLEEAELVRILLPILDGLETIHELGFIHRDIKPANIVIRADGSPVLIDFGSAGKARGIQTRTWTVMISPGYAPIEQYFGKGTEQKAWTDIYSLGATLYCAVAGKPPVDSMDRSVAILQSLPDPLIDIERIARDRYSTDFLKAIHHALGFREQDRPQSIAEWRREFGLPANPSQ